jgi:MFS superfamily sulfate permease-like transporter
MLGTMLTNTLISNNSLVLASSLNTIVIILKNVTSWYNSPVIATLLGIIIGFIINLLNDRIKEKKELDRYEYFILSKTKDIVKSNQVNTKIVENFVFKLYTDLRFPKLDSNKMIIDLLKKAKEGGSYQTELDKIDIRLEKLNRRRII